ncbi:hypothetical protein C5167_017951 [Papaver somniferum]|uniref:AP2/ERF domain-containing protein n=1 Tax=Papaver somniferum TaxID=3469 RepID=A0A4Y7IKV4_PAPSO|nr:hypothetical protein C5167_017951 [Papaver somniferum]
MEAGDSKSRRKISPRLLDLNSEWAVEEERRLFGGIEERKLELKLGPPNEEEKGFSNGSNRKNIVKSPSSNTLNSTVNKTPISLLFTSTLTSTTTTNNTFHYNYKKKQKISQYRGVTRDVRKGIHKAQIWDGSCRKEGKYDEEDAAAKAYDLAALKYFGPTARINFPVCNLI